MTQLTWWRRGPGDKALKDDNHGDPVVCLLHVTQTAACTQCEKAIDTFLSSIKKTLQKHVPVHAQGPLISNALCTAFQFQMSVWRMIGEECIRLMRAKHSDWCGLAGIVQAIVETFPKKLCSDVSSAAPRLRWLRSPLPSARSHLTMTTTTTMLIIMAPAPAFAGLILACRCPRTGTLAEQVAPTCPPPYFTGVPSIYRLTPRSNPVALLAWLQMTTGNVALAALFFCFLCGFWDGISTCSCSGLCIGQPQIPCCVQTMGATTKKGGIPGVILRRVWRS